MENTVEDKDKSDKNAETVKLSEVMDRLLAETLKPEVLYDVRPSVVESVGRKMISFGYEMSEWAVNVLCDYLKGYNLWLRGKPGGI